MASLTSSINLIDRMSPVLFSITNALDNVITAMDRVDQSTDTAFDPTLIYNARTAFGEANARLREIEQSLRQDTQQQERFNNNTRITGSNISRNTNQQTKFNNTLNAGVQSANKLLHTIGSIAGVYVGIQSIGNLVKSSDTYTQTQARLNLMVANQQELSKLQDQIFASAQRSRTEYTTMSDAVAKLALNAGHAFKNNAQILQFSENMNKMFKVSGATAEEQRASMLQLTQAMASGTLRGDELNSVLEQAPLVARGIEKYMGWAEGSIKNYASDGLVTSQIVKNAVLSMTDDINKQFKSMPMTWEQAWTQMKNVATYAFQDVYTEMNQFLNSDTGQAFIHGISGGLILLSNIAMVTFQIFEWGAELIINNWSVIGPLLIGIAVAVGTYMVINAVKSAAAWAMANWPFLVIVGTVAAVIYVLHKLGVKNSQIVGGICGGLNVAKEAFVNFGELIELTWDAITAGADATAQNFVTAFKNGFLNVKAWLWDMESSVIKGIANICEKLNKIPGVDIDTNGLYASAQTAADLANNAKGQKGEYIDVSAAMDSAASKYSPFESGWVEKAFDEGYTWGNNFVDSIGSTFDEIDSILNKYSGNNLRKLAGVDDINSKLDRIDKNTKDTAKAVSLSATDTKYMLDIARGKSIDRYTTSKINLNVVNNNNVNKDLDLDGIVNKMSRKMLKGIQEEWSSSVSR